MKNNMKSALTKKVHLKIVSSSGHDDVIDSAVNILERIKAECDENSKWAYINGTPKSPGSISLDDLLEAEDVTLTNALVGGYTEHPRGFIATLKSFWPFK